MKAYQLRCDVMMGLTLDEQFQVESPSWKFHSGTLVIVVKRAYERQHSCIKTRCLVVATDRYGCNLHAWIDADEIVPAAYKLISRTLRDLVAREDDEDEC